MDRHTSHDFDADLADLSERIRAMGERCARSLDLALAAFWDGAPELQRKAVTALDQEIDGDERAIDALAVEIIALRQPVAADLRFVAASMKVTTDLERIGADAHKISARANEAEGHARDTARPDLEAMARTVRGMLRDAVRAFVARDPDLAESVRTRDSDVDAGYGRVMDAMSHSMLVDPAGAIAAVRVIKVARYLERIGDHAANLGEETVFAVRGGSAEPGRERDARSSARPSTDEPSSPAEEHTELARRPLTARPRDPFQLDAAFPRELTSASTKAFGRPLPRPPRSPSPPPLPPRPRSPATEPSLPRRGSER